MPVSLSEIIPQKAAREAKCDLLPLAASKFFAVKYGRFAGVLAVDGAEAGLFLPGGVDAQLLDYVTTEASTHGAVRLSVRTPLGVALSEPFRPGRELLTWRRTPEDGPLPDPEEKLEPAPFSFVGENFQQWHPSTPAWEKRWESLARAPQVFGESLHVDVIRQKGTITAYIVYALRGNDVLILDAAVDPDVGVVKAGRPVFQALYLTYQESNVTAPSVLVDDPLNRVFVAMRYHVVRRAMEWFLYLEGGDVEESA